MDITDKQLKRLLDKMLQIGFVYNLSAHSNSTERNKSILSIAVWYFDGVAYSTLPTITKFESGKKYVYSVMLLPKIGYTFSKEVTVTVNGNTVTAVPATYENLSFTQVNIESLYNYGVGDFPRKTAEPFDEEADKYEIAHEFCK